MAVQKSFGITASWGGVALSHINGLTWDSIETGIIDMSAWDATAVIDEATKVSNVIKLSDGYVNGGKVTINGLFDPVKTTVATTGEQAESVGSTASLIITWASGKTWTASAILASLSVNAGDKDGVRATLVFEISGDITIADA